MKDLHEDCGVLNPDLPCSTYRCSVNKDDMCVFCGHTLHEHIEAYGNGLHVIRRPNVKHKRRLFPRKVKAVVGRNDPCPCGSGKKYKNCCKK